MNNKTIGIIIIVFGGLVLYSNQEEAWIISAIAIGIGSGIYKAGDSPESVSIKSNLIVQSYDQAKK